MLPRAAARFFHYTAFGGKSGTVGKGDPQKLRRYDASRLEELRENRARGGFSSTAGEVGLARTDPAVRSPKGGWCFASAKPGSFHAEYCLNYHLLRYATNDNGAF